MARRLYPVGTILRDLFDETEHIPASGNFDKCGQVVHFAQVFIGAGIDQIKITRLHGIFFTAVIADIDVALCIIGGDLWFAPHKKLSALWRELVKF